MMKEKKEKVRNSENWMSETGERRKKVDN